MIVLKKKINILWVLLLTIGMTSCDSDDDQVLSRLEARFISTVQGRTVTFENASNDAETYLWDFGNGTTSTLKDPVVTFENGTFTVTLEAISASGTSAFFQDSFTINCETEENIDPANGNLIWSFLTNDVSTTFEAFGNTAGQIVSNPVLDNVNGSCNVQQFVKSPGCFTFAGLGTELNTALDFNDPNASKVFTMKVLAETQVTEVTLRLEFMPFPNVNPAFDRVATITEVGEWQELTFDFTGVTGTFKSMIIYFERNAPCDGDVYYFDDIIQQ